MSGRTQQTVLCESTHKDKLTRVGHGAGQPERRRTVGETTDYRGKTWNSFLFCLDNRCNGSCQLQTAPVDDPPPQYCSMPGLAGHGSTVCTVRHCVPLARTLSCVGGMQIEIGLAWVGLQLFVGIEKAEPGGVGTVS